MAFIFYCIMLLKFFTDIGAFDCFLFKLTRPLFVVAFVAFLMWLVVAVSWLIIEGTARARAHNCGTTIPTVPLS